MCGAEGATFCTEGGHGRAAHLPAATDPGTGAPPAPGTVTIAVGVPALKTIGLIVIGAAFVVALVCATAIWPALGYQNDLGCDGLDCTDYASLTQVVTGADGALESFNPLIFWVTFGPGVVAGAIFVAAGSIVDAIRLAERRSL